MLEKTYIKKRVEWKGEVFNIKYLTLIDKDGRYFTNDTIISINNAHCEKIWLRKTNPKNIPKKSKKAELSGLTEDQLVNWEGIKYAFEEQGITDNNKISNLCNRFLRTNMIIPLKEVIIKHSNKIYDNWDCFAEFIEESKTKEKASSEEMGSRISSNFHELFAPLKKLANEERSD